PLTLQSHNQLIQLGTSVRVIAVEFSLTGGRALAAPDWIQEHVPVQNPQVAAKHGEGPAHDAGPSLTHSITQSGRQIPNSITTLLDYPIAKLPHSKGVVARSRSAR